MSLEFVLSGYQMLIFNYTMIHLIILLRLFFSFISNSDISSRFNSDNLKPRSLGENYSRKTAFNSNLSCRN